MKPKPGFRFNINFLILMLLIQPVEINAQQCDENFTFYNLNKFVESEYGQDLLSVWACKQSKDTKVEQKVYFNIRNLTSNTLYITFNITTYTDGGTEEKLREDSLFKILNPRSEISGFGSVVDDDLWIKLTKIHSSKEDKVADITFDIFSVNKLVDGKEVPVPSKSVVQNVPPKENMPVDPPKLEIPDPVPPPPVVANPPPSSPGDNTATGSAEIAEASNAGNSASAQKEQKQKAKEEKAEKKRQEKEAKAKKAEEERLAKEKVKQDNAQKAKEAQEAKALAANNKSAGNQESTNQKTIAEQPEVAVQDSLPAIIPSPDTLTANNKPTADSIPVKPINYAEDGPTKEDIEKAKIQVVEKIKQLEINFSALSNKNLSIVSWQNTVDNTVRMFIDEEQRIQISSVNRKSITAFKIRTYCQRLRTVLPYDSAMVENANVFFVSGFKKNADGKWEALTAFTQKFTGFRDNRPVYSDVTEKTIKVILDYKPLFADGVQKGNWELLLGDIKVLSTRSL